MTFRCRIDLKDLEEKMEQAGIERLEVKRVSEAIIERIEHDFNLAPLVARTLFGQIRRYFESYYQLKNDSGQLSYLAVSAASPAGQKLRESRRVTVKLSLYAADDLVAMRQGIGALRQGRIKRLTEEAYEQGGLLSHEDLSCLLSSSLSTIKREVSKLRGEELTVPTRGQIKDIGKGVSHKRQIVADYLAGYTFSEIEWRRKHSVGSIERYCHDFVRLIRLKEKKLSLTDMRRTTGLSERLIKQYLALYEESEPENERLQMLLSDPHPATDQPAQIKRGDLIR